MTDVSLCLNATQYFLIKLLVEKVEISDNFTGENKLKHCFLKKLLIRIFQKQLYINELKSPATDGRNYFLFEQCEKRISRSKFIEYI